MTINLPHVLQRLVATLPMRRRSRARPPLDLLGLRQRDIADLNLPGDVAARLMGREAEEMRRRFYL